MYICSVISFGAQKYPIRQPVIENDLEKPVNYSDREMVKDSWTLNGGELPELIVTLENGSQTELDI